MPEILPIMPALCSMLFDAMHYVSNYVTIIGSSLSFTVFIAHALANSI